MHELEPISFCTIEEYLRFKKQRKQASEIALDALYLALADIRRHPGEEEAFKFPVRTKRIDLIPLDFDVVTVDILDNDLKPASQSHFVMRDGVVQTPHLMVKNRQLLKELYFKDYEDYIGTGPGEARIEIEDEVGSKELAVVQ